MDPLCDFNTPSSDSKSVDLPLPFGPTRPMNSPLCTTKFISFRTTLPERITVKLLTYKIGGSQQSSTIEFCCTLIST